MWHENIVAKYLKNRPIEEWLRDLKQSKWNISNIWNNCIKYLHVVSNWIAWWPGNGTKISIGKDPILGSKNLFKLSTNILNVLHDKGIFYLSQALDIREEHARGMIWKSTNTLNLHLHH